MSQNGSNKSQDATLIEQSLRALRQQRQRVSELEAARHAPIAVIGMACRFPGADSLEAYWHLLSQGVDAIREIDPSRWQLEPGVLDAAGRHAGLLDRPGDFDAEFFGISPREASSMDPQQRWVLECAWHALENAGIPGDSLRGTKTGVFIGATARDYAARLQERQDETPIDAYYVSGNSLNFIAGRLAYQLGLQGPALAVDTACSSGLTAVHLAMQSIRRGESDLVLVGGVNIILAPEVSEASTRSNLLARNGRCKTFDAGADGIVRSEGCGMLVLLSLAEAERRGLPVLAVLRGSAINQDGASSGLMTPNGAAQSAVIRAALADANATPGQIDYIEAHGTGTALGDPIELRALNDVFGQRERPLWVGSVKTNIGHAESAAGIAALIKVVLSMRAGQMPKHLHLENPTPHFNWAEASLRVPNASQAWPSASSVAWAGVSAFGGSGSNAHVVVSGVEPVLAPATSEDQPLLLALSAKSRKALQAQVSAWHDAIAVASGHEAARALCMHANSGRARLDCRAAFVGRDVAALLEAMRAADTPEATGSWQGRAAKARPNIAFLFSGQGAQYVGMGQALRASNPVFAATLNRLAPVFLDAVGIDLEALFAPEAATLLANTRYAQPALFVLQQALVDSWAALGVRADVVLGHSVGEIAAACAAGVFDEETGLRLAAARGRLMDIYCKPGAMLAIAADATRVGAWLVAHPDVSLAGMNSNTQTVVAGPESAISALQSALVAETVRAVRLTVSHAFHSAMMEPMLAAFSAHCQGIALQPPSVDLISSRTGRLASAEITDAEHWVRHVREPVAFTEALRSLADERADVLIEIGPGNTLVGLARQAGLAGTVLPSLLRTDELTAFASAQAAAFCAGVNLHWPATKVPAISAPMYPFQHQTFWVPPKARVAVADAPPAGLVAWQWRQRPVPNGQSASETVLTTIRTDADLDVLAASRPHQVASDGGRTNQSILDLRFADARVESLTEVLARLATSYRAFLAKRRTGTYWVHLVRSDVDLGTSNAATAAVAAMIRSLSWQADAQIAMLHTGPRQSLEAPAIQALLQSSPESIRSEPEWRAIDDCLMVPRLDALQGFQGDSVGSLAHDDVVVVTGGFGDIGFGLIRALATRPHGCLVILSRQTEAALAEAKQVQLRSLRAAGANIVAISVDISDSDALSKALVTARHQGRITSVFHLAGHLVSSSLDQIVEASLAPRVLGAKLQGALALHALTQADAPARFVMVGSAAGTWGSPAHALYAAANAGLSGLCEYRLQQGLPAAMLALGPVAETGMAAMNGVAQLAAAGLHTLAIDTCVGQLLALPPSAGSITLVAASWAQFRAASRSIHPFQWFDALASEQAETATPTPESAASKPVSAWHGLAPGPRLFALQDLVREAVGKVLRVDPATLILDQPLLSVGMDSILALEIRDRLSAQFGQPLPATLVFEHGSVGAIAQFLAATPFSDAAPASAAAAATLLGSEEPIAIIGASARLPGGADTVDAFWQNLLQGVDGVVDTPKQRFAVDAWMRPDNAERPYTMAFGALQGIEYFDAAMFGIAPREARLMDPQQRVVLQTVWHALEHAGIDPLSLRGEQAGVFLGVADNEYLPLLRRHLDLGPDLAYLGTGSKLNVIAGRVSYMFGLQGPSVAIDTACSSSAVAIHLACQSLRSGESNVALAGGVNLILDPSTFASPCKANMLAPDGRCKSFDVRANGYVRAEGCGILVLKRLADAERDGDSIIAVILGSAVNQDGRSSSLTAPNPAAQQQVIESALTQARVTPDAIDVIEAHGTGTNLGDPIEWQALQRVFARPTRQKPLWVGSAKSQIGHAEAAAGVAGVLKMALSLQNGLVPPNRHFATLNPQAAEFGTAPLQVPVLPITLAPARVHIGGVSSFGFSGTNAHLLLSSAPIPAAQRVIAQPVLALSAADAATFEALRLRWIDTLAKCGDDQTEYLGLCAASRLGRWCGPVRFAVAAASAADALSVIREVGAVGTATLTATGSANTVLVNTLDLAGSQTLALALGVTIPSDRPALAQDLATVLLALHLKNLGVSVATWQRGNASLSVLAAIALGLSGNELLAWLQGEGRERLTTTTFAERIVDSDGQLLRDFDHLRAQRDAVPATREPALQSGGNTDLAQWLKGWATDSNVALDAHLRAAAFTAGLSVRWPDTGAKRSPRAPLYPFAETRYWPHELPVLVPTEPELPMARGHYAIGERITLPRSNEVRFRRRFTAHAPAYVDHHRLLNTVVVPAASHLSMVLCAWKEIGGAWPCTIEDVRLLSPLVLHDHGARWVELILTRGDGQYGVELVSCDESNVDDEQGWVTHMRCQVRAGATGEPAPVAVDLLATAWQPTITRESFYAQFWEHGYTLGDSFCWLGSGWVRNEETVRQVYVPALPDDLSAFELYPGLIDTCFSVLSSGQLGWTSQHDAEHIFIPVSIERLEFYGWREGYAHSWMHARAWKQPVAEGARAREDICLFETEGHVVARIVGFETRRAQREALKLGYRDSVRDWLYQAVWQPIGNSPIAKLDDRFAVIGDWDPTLHAGLGQKLLWQVSWPDVTSLGQTATAIGFEDLSSHWANRVPTQLLLYVDADSQLLGEGLSRSNPDAPARDKSSTCPDSVTQRLATECSFQRGQSMASIASDLVQRIPGNPWGCLRAIVAVWQHLQAMNLRSFPRVLVLVRANDLQTSPVLAAISGLMRTIQIEHPDLDVRLLEAPASLQPAVLSEAIQQCFASGDPDRVWRWQEDSLQVRRLQRYKPTRTHADLTVRTGARYLVTGANGGLGQALVQHLLENGAGCVQALVRRRDDDLVSAWQRLASANGGRIECIQLDSDWLQAVRQHKLPIAGIYHAAGSTADALIRQAALDSIDHVLAPKWALTESLLQLSQQCRPEFVVLFGSLAATLPAQGQALYAAANAVLNAYAEQFRRYGVPAVSIGFGPFGEAGMTARLGSVYQKRLVDMGLAPFTLAQGLHVIGQLAQEPEAQIIAALVDWPRFFGHRSEYAELPMLAAFQTQRGRMEQAAQGSLYSRLQSLPEAQRNGELESALKTLIATVLGLAGPGQVGRQRRLFDLGLDSMAAMDLRERLQQQLAIKLRATVLFDYPSVEALSRFLLSELFVEAAPVAAAAANSAAVLNLEALTDAEAEALLLAELKE